MIQVGEIRKRVRYHLRDRDPSNYAVSNLELTRKIQVKVRALAAKVNGPPAWTIPALNITPATDTYPLPGTSTYTQVLVLRLESIGRDLDIMTREGFQLFRAGLKDPSKAVGDPRIATLWEDSNSVRQCQLHPWPRKADAIDMFSSTLPPAVAIDSDNVPFDELEAESLCYAIAAELAAEMTPEAMQGLLLSPDAPQVFQSAAAELLRDARVRKARIRSVGNIRRERMR